MEFKLLQINAAIFGLTMKIFPKQNIPKPVTSPLKNQNQISTCKWSLNTGFSPAGLNRNSGLQAFRFQAYKMLLEHLQ
jgi:hypothetical protein